MDCPKILYYGHQVKNPTGDTGDSQIFPVVPPAGCHCNEMSRQSLDGLP